MSSVLIVIIILSMLNSLYVWNRKHVNLDLSNHIYSSKFFKSYSMPIQYDGQASKIWRSVRSEFDKRIIPWKNFSDNCSDCISYPFNVIESYDENWELLDIDENEISNTEILYDNINGSDYEKSIFGEIEVFGSYATSDLDTGHIILKMKKGDKIAFKRGPSNNHFGTIEVIGSNILFSQKLPLNCTDWSYLDFSNSLLPDNFMVKFSDDGTKFGEWFAIGIKNN